MSGWLEPLRRALDAADRPVTFFFFRDDDVGWADDRLWLLLDRFASFALPVDLAVIPAALAPEPARLLRSRIAGSGGLIAAHQHGHTHANHEPAGRKHEFGPARTAEQQRRDLALGFRVLSRDATATALGPRGAGLMPAVALRVSNTSWASRAIAGQS